MAQAQDLSTNFITRLIMYKHSFITVLTTRFFVAISIVCIFSVNTSAQDSTLHQKLSPKFVHAIAQVKHSEGKTTGKCFLRSKKQHLQKALSDTLYECIIYTRHPQILTKNKINLQSVYPTFVTARVTLQQMLDLARLPEITFIEAPSENITT